MLSSILFRVFAPQVLSTRVNLPRKRKARVYTYLVTFSNDISSRVNGPWANTDRQTVAASHETVVRWAKHRIRFFTFRLRFELLILSDYPLRNDQYNQLPFSSGNNNYQNSVFIGEFSFFPVSFFVSYNKFYCKIQIKIFPKLIDF